MQQLGGREAGILVCTRSLLCVKQMLFLNVMMMMVMMMIIDRGDDGDDGDEVDECDVLIQLHEGKYVEMKRNKSLLIPRP